MFSTSWFARRIRRAQGPLIAAAIGCLAMTTAQAVGFALAVDPPGHICAANERVRMTLTGLSRPTAFTVQDVFGNIVQSGTVAPNADRQDLILKPAGNGWFSV